jgi:DNA-binding beta-propeller fold protein YncE
MLTVAACGAPAEEAPAPDTQAEVTTPVEETGPSEEAGPAEETEPLAAEEATTEPEEAEPAVAIEDEAETATAEPQVEETTDMGSPEEVTEAPAVLDKIFYGDTWTWPFQTDALAHLSNGRFYIPVQDDNKIAVLDPDAPDYGLTFVETEFVQPHHPWIAPGMRYNWINFQSEGKGDHDVIAVQDTFTNEIIKYIHTGSNDPFHMAFSPVENLLVTADLDPEAGRVHLFDTEAMEQIAEIETTGTETRDIVLTHDGKYAFIGHQGYAPEEGNVGAVDLLDIANQEIVKSFGEGRCRAGKMSNDGKIVLYSCDRSDQIVAIDTETLSEIKRIQMPEGSGTFNISFRPDDKYAYVGLSAAEQIGIINVESLELEKVLDSGTATNSTYFHPYAPVAVTTNDGTDTHVTVVDTENHEVITTIETGGKGTHNGVWTPDGRYFLVTNRLGDSVTLLAYDDEAGEVVWVDDITVGFAANGVHWAPYFCGVEELTNENVQNVTNQAPVDATGACSS